MDQDTRNHLQRATQQVRRILEEEFAEQLEGTFDVLPSGKVLLEPGKHLDAKQRLVRQKLVDALEHIKAGGQPTKGAVAQYTREAAFTFLNRFVALQMLEARGILQECVSQGDESSGFKEFCGLAPGLSRLDDGGYRLYLESLFDELSVEVKVLFDRRDAASLLWPRRAALREVLEVLARLELSNVWAEDETIGWVYQYYNDPAERKKMRNESAAPRNSRELAVRNQFFTPRYVVEFLTDNTLGRIWYEMTKGETRLVEQCRYLVRRPTEIFLDEGEEAPEPAIGDAEEPPSQEELLKQPVYIPHRPVKDPREIRLLDPACGSMHFGLYAFDLFEAIYEEAFDKGLCSALQDAYPEKADYLRDIPRLIIEHNIHGVDIDPRAVQIAGLSLWLRAQKAWRDISAVERPCMQRSNIVCAEPMPGNAEMLDEFVATLDPPILGELVKSVFDKMKLAGEAGTLLKIEEEIRTDIDAAREEALRQSGDLFKHAKAADVDFFDTAEDHIYEALEKYAESAEADDYQRRLFAEDAAHGFAFIDLCRQRYDTVVMNPPFGSPSKQSKNHVAQSYTGGKHDVIAAFVERGVSLLYPFGFLGAITSRTVFFLSSFEEWRENIVLRDAPPVVFADLGYGVMDAAMVEAAAYCLEKKNSLSPRLAKFIRATDTPQKSETLLCCIEDSAVASERCFDINPQVFPHVPTSPFAYWASKNLRNLFRDLPCFESETRFAYSGTSTGNDDRFIRLWWEVQEVGARWRNYTKGGRKSHYYADLSAVIDWKANGLPIELSYAGGRIRKIHFGREALTWPLRGIRFSACAVPKGCIFGTAGKVAIAEVADLSWLLAILNSTIFDIFIAFFAGKIGGVQYEVGLIQSIPIPTISGHVRDEISSRASSAWELKRELDSFNLTSHSFLVPLLVRGSRSLHESIRNWGELNRNNAESVDVIQQEIDELVFELYGLAADDREIIQRVPSSDLGDEAEENEDSVDEGAIDSQACAAAMIDYMFGCALGNFDIRYIIGERQPPELPDPFDPLPICPPGMLQNADGLPAAPADLPDDYPLRITWPGILVDDEGHPEDIVARVRDALTIIWGDRSSDIAQESCEILEVRTLRNYFQSKSGFFTDHIKRYSKSRRKAPIYWQLATPSASYSVWLYCHRFTRDTCFQVLSEFVEPKLQHERQKLSRLQGEGGTDPTASQRKAMEKQEKLVSELSSMAEEVERVAPLWNPNLNDGVIINFAPLWRLVPQNQSWQTECKKVWDKLVKGEYDWAHLAMHLWPERVIPKCPKDASLAIAHGLDEVFWEQDEKGKYQVKEAPEGGWEPVTKKLVVERTSSAVKAALESLLDAPAPTAKKKTRRRKASQS